MAETSGPKLRFSHLGICVTNLPKMEKFYCDIVGMTVTDRGNALGCDLVFLSADPNDHHQIVLGSGRPENLPQNTANDMFGPCINQISFDVTDLGGMRDKQAIIAEKYPEGEMIFANHGTAWSIYVHDPEGNMLEFFVDTEWYIPQPVFDPLDLSMSDKEIYAVTEDMCINHAEYQPVSTWRANIAKTMGKTWP